MDTNHGAAGDPADEDVFGPVEDGEEVFEWVDDQDGADEAEDPAARRPAPTFRERLAAARAGGTRLRHARREITVVAAVLLLACGAGGGATAWFDGVAGAADRADVVSLALDSVVDGDPAAASYKAADFSAVGQYVAEVANNSPDAVTLDSVSADAGTMMTSTAWKPLGSARIPAGRTAKVALTMRMFCPMVVLGRQTGLLSAGSGSGSGGSLTFPALHVQVRDSDGGLHDLDLQTRVTASAQLAEGQSAFRGPGGQSIPEIVSADFGACGQYAADRGTPRTITGGTARFPGTVTFGYDKVLSAADKSFVLGFTVKNTSDHAEALTTRALPFANGDNWVHTDWLPSRLDLAPGQSAQAQLKVVILGCTGVLTNAPVLGETMLEVDDSRDGSSQPVFIEQALTGSLRLEGDVVKQKKAACS